MFCKNQVFLVLGVSRSGCAVSEYLISEGARTFVFDDSISDKTRENLEKLSARGVTVADKENIGSVVDATDVLVISPGVPINHAVAVKCKEKGKRIMGELEFGFSRFLPTTVAVTGTNGKTTTVSLIDSVLKAAKIEHETVGNVGVPVTSVINDCDKNTLFVAEVSSFQLESVSSFCPHIACILNIAPDHLERHYSMDNYVYLKKRIFKNQKESEYTVLNYDDLTVRGFSSQTAGKVVFVSVKEEVDGAYVKDSAIYYKGERIIDVKDLAVKGEHNVYNAAFAIVCAKLLGVDNDSIVSGLTGFKGIKHRLEKVLEKDGVIYYNDSKSTNTASCISAIGFMDRPFVIVLGGSEKGEKYDLLFGKIAESACRYVVITGASRYSMMKAARDAGIDNFTLSDDFDSALKVAFSFARTGDAVLFSPACASFDRFNGYEERGEAFVKAVSEFADK